MKYVIKNCDNYTDLDKDWTCRSTIQNRKGCYNCQSCTDCVMKQIVKKCKKSLEVSYCPIEQEILELLDIQEVE